MPPVIIFRLNTLKDTAVAPAVDLLRLNTLRGTKTAFLIPKRYDDHPVLFICFPPPSGLYPGRDTFEFDQSHVTENQPITVLVLLRESLGIWQCWLFEQKKTGHIFSGALHAEQLGTENR